MKEAQQKVLETDRAQLAALMDVSPDDARVWRPEELAAILRHQLSAPLQVDLITLEQGLAARLRTLAESHGLLLKSFDDLLQHPNPPLELLKITKQFAKSCRISPNSPVPHDIASVLYFTSIAVALTRCRRRISGLGNGDLAKGFGWLVAQSWVDDPTRALVAEALDIVNGSGGTDHDG